MGAPCAPCHPSARKKAGTLRRIRLPPLLVLLFPLAAFLGRLLGFHLLGLVDHVGALFHVVRLRLRRLLEGHHRRVEFQFDQHREVVAADRVEAAEFDEREVVRVEDVVERVAQPPVLGVERRERAPADARVEEAGEALEEARRVAQWSVWKERRQQAAIGERVPEWPPMRDEP